MAFFLGAVLAHVIDLAGLAGLLSGLIFHRRKNALGIALILSAVVSLWAPGMLVSSSFSWRLATNAPAALLVAWIVHKLRHRKKSTADTKPEQSFESNVEDK